MVSIFDGEFNLLDNIFVICGVCIGEFNDYDYMDLFILFVGGGLFGNCYIVVEKYMLMCDLLLLVL